MLLLQAPGSFLVVFFHWRYHESVSTWLPFFITGIQMIFLLGMCIYYEMKKRRHRSENIQEEQRLLPPYSQGI
jgi:hypothetical protein